MKSQDQMADARQPLETLASFTISQRFADDRFMTLLSRLFLVIAGSALIGLSAQIEVPWYPVQGEVMLTGEPSEGQTIVASTARISDEDGIASMSVGWESSTDGRNWRVIETAGTTQIPLTQALVNRQIRARVAVVDSFGIETVIFSQATNTVKNVNNKPAGTIFVRRVGN